MYVYTYIYVKYIPVGGGGQSQSVVPWRTGGLCDRLCAATLWKYYTITITIHNNICTTNIMIMIIIIIISSSSSSSSSGSSISSSWRARVRFRLLAVATDLLADVVVCFRPNLPTKTNQQYVYFSPFYMQCHDTLALLISSFTISYSTRRCGDPQH